VRVVLDTSVLLAAFATHGLCESVLTICLQNHELLVSQALVAEVRAGLVKKLKVADHVADDIVALLCEYGETVYPAPVAATTCRDPNDLHVLGLATAGKAVCLVTGDKDLLVLDSHGACRIVSPRQFLELLRRGER